MRVVNFQLASLYLLLSLSLSLALTTRISLFWRIPHEDAPPLFFISYRKPAGGPSLLRVQRWRSSGGNNNNNNKNKNKNKNSSSNKLQRQARGGWRSEEKEEEDYFLEFSHGPLFSVCFFFLSQVCISLCVFLCVCVCTCMPARFSARKRLIRARPSASWTRHRRSRR